MSDLLPDLQPGERIAYRAIAGDTYDATIVAVLPVTGIAIQRVDVAVHIPGVSEPWPLSAVVWSDDPADPQPGARPLGLTAAR